MWSMDLLLAIEAQRPSRLSCRVVPCILPTSSIYRQNQTMAICAPLMSCPERSRQSTFPENWNSNQSISSPKLLRGFQNGYELTTTEFSRTGLKNKLQTEN